MFKNQLIVKSANYNVHSKFPIPRITLENAPNERKVNRLSIILLANYPKQHPGLPENIAIFLVTLCGQSQ